MRKSLKMLVLLVVMAVILTICGSAYAATVNNFKDWGVADVQESEGVHTIKLTKNLTDGDPKLSQDLIINEGEKVILDLNGFTLQGYKAGCETILVNAGAELTIVDNSAGKTGKIIPATGAGDVQLPVIRNNGTLKIEGGTFEQNDAYGTIINWGTANINGGTFVQEEDAKWSILDNKGSLTINNGDFDGAASFWMVRNEANLTVTGGDFDSTGNANMIGSIYEGESLPAENNVSTTIENGTFNSEGGIFVVYEGTDLAISGGEITSVQSNAVYNAGNTTITGGTIKSENSSAIQVVHKEGEETPTVTISGENVKITSAEGNDNIVINNPSDTTNVAVGTDENGNTVVGEAEIIVNDLEVTVGETVTLDVTVKINGTEVTPENMTIVSSDDEIVKVNDDNTITALAAGDAVLTISANGVEKQINVTVAEKAVDPGETTDPEDPTTPPEETTDPENEAVSGEDSEIVQTGDYIYIVVAILVLVVLGNVVYTIKKKHNK